jgi:hypothetical protein
LLPDHAKQDLSIKNILMLLSVIALSKWKIAESSRSTPTLIPKCVSQIPKPFICLAQKAFTRVLTPSPAKGGAGLVLLIVRTLEAC